MENFALVIQILPFILTYNVIFFGCSRSI